MMLSEPELSAYLDRIGYGGPRAMAAEHCTLASAEELGDVLRWPFLLDLPANDVAAVWDRIARDP